MNAIVLEITFFFPSNLASSLNVAGALKIRWLQHGKEDFE